jgi:hypothetical protein
MSGLALRNEFVGEDNRATPESASLKQYVGMEFELFVAKAKFW